LKPLSGKFEKNTLLPCQQNLLQINWGVWWLSKGAQMNIPGLWWLPIWMKSVFSLLGSLMMASSSSSLWGVGGTGAARPAGGDPYQQRQGCRGNRGKIPHILTAEEKAKPVKLKTMYIDIGSTSKEETEKAGVKQGDPPSPTVLFISVKMGSLLWPRRWTTG